MSTNQLGRPIALRPSDVRYHTHPTGSGKSTLLENMALASIVARRAVVFLDIKGDSIYRLLRRIPVEHWGRVWLLDPALSERVVGLNVLELADAERRDLVADQVVAIFRRLFSQYWKDRSDDVMRSAVLTLLHHPGTTLCDVPGLLLDIRSRRWRSWSGPTAPSPQGRTDREAGGSILGRRGSQPGDGRQLEAASDALNAEHRALTARLGREALSQHQGGR